MSRLNIGLDNGNYFTKTVLTSTPSGYTSYNNKPFFTDEFLYLDGKYYIPNPEPFPYRKNKTQNEDAFILSMFGIAKEVYARTQSKVMRKGRFSGKKEEFAAIQAGIEQCTSINLGVGVPPTHYSTLKNATVSYYEDRLKNGIEFIYSDFHYIFKLNSCDCFAQDLAAVIGYVPSPEIKDSVTSYKKYYAIDIGGMTADIVTFMNGGLDMRLCDSKPLGILKMYEDIINKVEMETGKRIEQDIIETVLRNEPCVLEDCMKALIRSLAKDWFFYIINSFSQLGADFESYPVLFLGGGSLLFRQFFDTDIKFAKYEFIENSNANAVGYEKLIALQSRRK